MEWCNLFDEWRNKFAMTTGDWERYRSMVPCGPCGITFLLETHKNHHLWNQYLYPEKYSQKPCPYEGPNQKFFISCLNRLESLLFWMEFWKPLFRKCSSAEVILCTDFLMPSMYWGYLSDRYANILKLDSREIWKFLWSQVIRDWIIQVHLGSFPPDS